MDPTLSKEAMKTLRQQREAYISRARKRIKEANGIISSIQKEMALKPKTVPEIAEAIKTDPATILLFVSALKKYGVVTEGPKKGDYFTYEKAQQ